ncbi:MAG: DUF692 domain-containing protein [Rhodobiaceae bacterium]|nr:DUF692 domain-containing protein [Rhodobiaceae bacterium]MCC0057194.1 DUF692 domain-containing protein [Rhodobiaceae bacterium]
MNAHSLAGRFGPHAIPLRAGVGLKPDHYQEIAESTPDIGWFEVHPENYMGAGGPPHHFLERIRGDYPLSLHGVGLSIGSDGPLDKDHLARLAVLVKRYEPGLFSEHLAWSTHESMYLNDLLPVPYTRAAQDRICEHVDEVQAAIKRPMLLENPSTYVRFAGSEMDEVEFLEGIARQSGCGLLLDVNNVYVSATNHAYDAHGYIDRFPVDLVGEIHLGGHSRDEDDAGEPLLIDDHGSAVADPVWALYAHAIGRAGAVPTLIEWDNDIPAWPVLQDEAAAAEALMRRMAGKAVKKPHALAR